MVGRITITYHARTWLMEMVSHQYVHPHRERALEVFHLGTNCYAWGNEPVVATIYSGMVLLLKVGSGWRVLAYIL